MNYLVRLTEYCREYWNIENYELAESANFKGWVCHHRYEIDNNGETRYTASELKEMNLYYDRPSYELIFMTTSEHRKLHNNTTDYKESMSKAKKNHIVTEETKDKIAKAAKGRYKGMKWKLVNGKRVWYKEGK